MLKKAQDKFFNDQKEILGATNLSEEQYQKAQEDYGEDAFRAGIGAEAIKALLSQIDLAEEAKKLRAELIETKADMKRKKIVKKLKLVEAFLESGSRPEPAIRKHSFHHKHLRHLHIQ